MSAINLIGMRVRPQTFRGGDLPLREAAKPPIAKVLSRRQGQHFPANFVLSSILRFAHSLPRTDLPVFPRASLIRLAEDLDYAFGLFLFVDSFVTSSSDSPISAAKARTGFIAAVHDPNTIRFVDSIDGYELFMNNFMGYLPGGFYRRDVELHRQLLCRLEQLDETQRATFADQINGLLSGVAFKNKLFPVIDRLIEEITGQKPEEAGLLYRPGMGKKMCQGLSEPEINAILNKRRQLYQILEKLVCDHGYELRKLTA